jgi:hypothetical protein
MTNVLLVFTLILVLILLIDVLYLHKKLENAYLYFNKSLNKVKEDTMMDLLQYKAQLIEKLILVKPTKVEETPTPLDSKRSEAAKRMWARRKAAKSVKTQLPEPMEVLK